MGETLVTVVEIAEGTTVELGLGEGRREGTGGKEGRTGGKEGGTGGEGGLGKEGRMGKEGGERRRGRGQKKSFRAGYPADSLGSFVLHANAQGEKLGQALEVLEKA